MTCSMHIDNPKPASRRDSAAIAPGSAAGRQLSVFDAVRSPKLLLKERQALWSRISIAQWKQWGKLTGRVGARRADYQTSDGDYAKVPEPDYCKARLLEIGVGRRFWQSNPSPENAHTFYERVVQPLRRLHCQGVLEKLQEITATDDRTPIAVEIIGQVDLTKVSKQ